MALDTAGTAYLTGVTQSFDFPTRNPYQAGYLSGGGDAFLSAFSSGTDLVYSTYLGGSGTTREMPLPSPRPGPLISRGQPPHPTSPPGIPIRTISRGGVSDAFVSIFTPFGGLSSSTYLGGSDLDVGWGVVLDVNGDLFLGGTTESLSISRFSNPYQATLPGGPRDIFLTRFSTPDTLFFSTYLGGSGHDWGAFLAPADPGAVFLSGLTNSVDFPTWNAYQNVTGR